MSGLKLKYQPHIDGLRALAVVLVVGFHAFPAALPGGFVGVDIFFVISGFLISSVLFDEFERPGRGGLRVLYEFYLRRIRRIFPSLLVVMAACFYLGYTRLLPTAFSELCRHLTAGAAFCLNLVLSGETGYFAGDSLSKPLLHLWSLGVEEQFYFVWPLFLWGATRLRIRLLPAIVFLASVSFCWSVYQVWATPEQGFFLPQMRLWELMIGAITAWLGRSAENPGVGLGRGGEGLGLAGFALIIGSAWRIGSTGGAHPWLLLAGTVGAALLIAAGRSSAVNRTLLSTKALVWIGLVSYPFYLWHWPLLTFARTTAENGTSDAATWAMVGLSLVLAVLTYWLVETPIRRGGHLGTKVGLLAAGMAVLGVGGAYTHRHRGFESRFPPLIRELSHLTYAEGSPWFGHALEGPWRIHRYFLYPNENPSRFEQGPDVRVPGRPLLYLWGDSYAAHLYPGYVASLGSTYNLVQRTAGGTAPILGMAFKDEGSRAINDFIFREIERDRPDTVVLSANWSNYHWARVEGTVVRLQALHLKHLIVVGQVPLWEGGLPQVIFRYLRLHPGEPVPLRTWLGVNPAAGRLEPLMAAMCARLRITYVSPYRILGNPDGFLVRVGETAQSITAFDEGHLTVAGSQYLVAHFPRE